MTEHNDGRLKGVAKALKGKAFLLKLGDGSNPPRYATIAGLRVEQITLAEPWALLAARGIFVGNFALDRFREFVGSGDVAQFELSFEGGEKIAGEFFPADIRRAGKYNGEESYFLTLQLPASALESAVHAPEKE